MTAALAALLAGCGDHVSIPPMRPASPPAVEHSVRIDFGEVVSEHTDWKRIAAQLDAAHVNTVDLDAGRVEFTAFDWSGHEDAAADPGTDHIAVAADAVHASGDGEQRQVNLVVDALVPKWIKSDPSIAGVDAEGRRSEYIASASQLYDGPVGDRLVAYVAALGQRYDPNQVSITELMLGGYTFGADDLALFKKMTGASDWPRARSGAIDTGAPQLGAWRAQVLVDLLTRMRAALDRVRDGTGTKIRLALDVRVNWDDPAAGVPEDGADYKTLLTAADRLVLWAYFGEVNRSPAAIRRLTAELADAGVDMRRISVSIGLWQGDVNAKPQRAIPPAQLARAVRAAETDGVRSVGITPLRLLTPAHWNVLDDAWSTTGSIPSPR
jgi:hypothetical protein